MSLITNEQLFGLEKQFTFFIHLYNKNKLPKVLNALWKKRYWKIYINQSLFI